MALPTPGILNPQVIKQVIDSLRLNSRLADFFAPAGTFDHGGRVFGWDLFDSSREVATGRMPGTPSATVAPRVVGQVTGTFPRVRENMPLLYEIIHNLRTIGSQEIDIRGERYITNQIRYMAQRLANHVELQWAAMFRGHYYYVPDGDDLNIALTSSGNIVDVDYAIPAGNLTTLDMLGAGAILGTSWDNAAAPIPTDIGQIKAAFETLTGRTLRHVWVNSTVMEHVLNNTAVKGLAGTANVVFNERTIDDKNDETIVLKGIPWLTWHVTDGTVDLNGTSTSLIADTQATFMPDPSADWVEYYNGSEPVVERPGEAAIERFGEWAWTETSVDPAAERLHTVHNGIPALKIPKCIATGTVVF